MKRFKVVAAVAAVWIASSALAQAQHDLPLTVEDRKAKYQAQIDLLNKERDLIKAQRDVAGSSAFSLPSILSISSTGSAAGQRNVALLQLANGTTEYVHEGDMLRQGVMVTTISHKQVIVAVLSGRKMVPLPLDFMAVGAAAQTPNGQPVVPNELLPSVPDVNVPAIAVIPKAVPAAAPMAPTVTAVTPQTAVVKAPVKGK